MNKLTRIGEAEGTALALELDELDESDDLNTDLDSDDVAGFARQDLRLIPVTSLSNISHRVSMSLRSRLIFIPRQLTSRPPRSPPPAIAPASRPASHLSTAPPRPAPDLT